MSYPRPVFIVAAKRTPIGSFLGPFASLSAPQLGAIAIRAALAQARVPAELVNEVFMGNVLTAGVGQSPARQASRFAGLPDGVPTTTVGKVCGSGMQSVLLGARAIAVGDAEVVVAGGQESMSRVPYYLTKAREGYRMGNAEMVDGMVFDGLTDPYGNFHMGIAGEKCASEHDLGREVQDAFATESYRRAMAAQQAGHFNDEIAPVSVPQGKGEPLLVTVDDEPGRGKPEKFPSLRPVFKKDGTITAANASSINDGASALVLASEDAVKRHGLEPLARIAGHGTAAQEPEWFTTAPAAAVTQALGKLSLQAKDIGLHEINEAFSVVPLVVAKLCGLDPSTINIRGGAVALGHPIGASGARILTTLVYAMRDEKIQRGCASICIGGGEALATILER
ncbi:MAG: acetyl-CoA C-acyltransferase [Deltaproteobacteria bacterium]|nr:acetyl-CoA C-acyltransferase [Deltaproteobacteria bacterium]